MDINFLPTCHFFIAFAELQYIWLPTVTTTLIEVSQSVTKVSESMACLRRVSVCNYGTTIVYWNYEFTKNRV